MWIFSVVLLCGSVVWFSSKVQYCGSVGSVVL